MKRKEKPLDRVLAHAVEEVRKWPEWMRSDENRREMERIKRERAERRAKETTK